MELSLENSVEVAIAAAVIPVDNPVKVDLVASSNVPVDVTKFLKTDEDNRNSPKKQDDPSQNSEIQALKIVD